jgi:hypothetical protein
MPVAAIGHAARTLTPSLNTGARERLHQAVATNDPRARDVAQRVDRLVTDRFGGDYRAAFQHYAGGAREVGPAGVRSLLSDAGVGNGLTRGAYVDALMDRFDSNRSGGVSWQEFQGGLQTIR